MNQKTIKVKHTEKEG